MFFLLQKARLIFCTLYPFTLLDERWSCQHNLFVNLTDYYFLHFQIYIKKVKKKYQNKWTMEDSWFSYLEFPFPIGLLVSIPTAFIVFNVIVRFDSFHMASFYVICTGLSHTPFLTFILSPSLLYMESLLHS